MLVEPTLPHSSPTREENNASSVVTLHVLTPSHSSFPFTCWSEVHPQNRAVAAAIRAASPSQTLFFFFNSINSSFFLSEGTAAAFTHQHTNAPRVPPASGLTLHQPQGKVPPPTHQHYLFKMSPNNLFWNECTDLSVMNNLFRLFFSFFPRTSDLLICH